ncbi:MAG TPA: BTAD domain-containing putative transcriptional regulator, partial [Chloroflexota bacterium]|nr:BTAD domain-containing putative transcriptional regulator [Chloroflexota bacterium]
MTRAMPSLPAEARTQGGTGPGTRLEIGILGTFHAWRVTESGREPVLWSRPTGMALLKLLAVQPGHQLHEELAVEALWPGIDTETGRDRLRRSLYLARQALEPDVETRSPAGLMHRAGRLVVLAPAPAVRIDADEFEEGARLALAAADIGSLQESLDLYGGPLLAEDPFEDWAITRREALAALRLKLLRALASIHQASGRTSEAIGALQAILAGDPGQEDIVRMLMWLHTQAGSRHTAFQLYQQCRRFLNEELGAAPEKETEALLQELLNAVPAPSVASAKPGALPVPAVLRQKFRTELVGRRHTLLSLAEGLGISVKDQGPRFRGGRTLLLSGDAGIGKTRLAAELAESAYASGMAVLWGSAREGEGQGPYGAISQAVDGFLVGLSTGDGLSLSRSFSELSSILPSLPRTERAVAGTGDGERARFMNAIVRLLDDVAMNLAPARGLLLVLDDLHAADAGTLNVVTHLTRNADGHPWSVLLLFRPEDVN